MLESLNISGFRRYDHLRVERLGQINFIAGNNNTGKTSILEAVYTWACGQNVVPIVYAPLIRCRYPLNQSAYFMIEELLSLVHERNSFPLSMRFDGRFDGKAEIFEHKIYPSELLSTYVASYQADNIRLEESFHGPDSKSNPTVGQMWSGTPPVALAEWHIMHNRAETETTLLSVPFQMISTTKPFCPAKFVDLLSFASMSETVQVYAALKRRCLLDEMVEQMQRVFPDIAGFDMIPYPDGSQAPVSVVKKDRRMLPLYSYGDGVQKWFYLIGTMVLCKDSIVCVDEVDTGFHPLAQKEFCANLIHAAQENRVQLFLATHNIEFMDSFLAAAYESGAETMESIRVLTLRESEQGVQLRNLDAGEAVRARERYNLELR